MAVLMGGEAVDDFVERAVPAASDDEAAVFGGGAGGDFRGMAGAGGFGEVSVNTAAGENVARPVEQTATAVAAVAGVGVVDHQGVLQVCGHSYSSWSFVRFGKRFILYNSRPISRIGFVSGARKRKTGFLQWMTSVRGLIDVRF